MKRAFLILLAVLLLGCTAKTAVVEPAAESSPAASTEQPRRELPATEQPTAVPTLTAVPTAEPTPVPQPFTLAWSGDTQTMIVLQRMTPGFDAMCDWLTANAQDRHIAAFLHTGDMVDGAESEEQWARFSAGARRVAAVMPLAFAAGNHDYPYPNAPTLWKEQFFVAELPEAARFRDGEAFYQTLDVEGVKLLLVGVCYATADDPEVVAWTKAACDAFPDRKVILITHSYLSAEGKRTRHARLLEEGVAAVCPNVRLVLSGHARGVSRRAFSYDDDGDGIPDRTVHALMNDTQLDRERYGYLNLLTFDPVANTLSVDSYSPLFDDFICDDANPDAERFIIESIF